MWLCKPIRIIFRNYDHNLTLMPRRAVQLRCPGPSCYSHTNNDSQLLSAESAPLAARRMCDLSNVATVRVAAKWLYGASPKVEQRAPENNSWTAERVLDAASSGPLWLQNSEIALCVERALERGAQLERFVLRAYVVMPNHVHALLEPNAALHEITNGIKGASAREAKRQVIGLAPECRSGYGRVIRSLDSRRRPVRACKNVYRK